MSRLRDWCNLAVLSVVGHYPRSLILRQFCRVYLEGVPDDTTLIRWANLRQSETPEQFNQRLTELATQMKVTKGRKMRTDGTVVETNIHPPAIAGCSPIVCGCWGGPSTGPKQP